MRLPNAVLLLAALSLSGLACQKESPAVRDFQAGKGGAVIPAQAAGHRYPINGSRLEHAVAELLDKASLPAPGPVRAIVVPHAGLAFSGETAAEAFSAIRDRRFDRVVILGPSHAGAAKGAVIPEAKAMSTPLGELAIDPSAVALLLGQPGFIRSDAPYRGEHSIEDVLPFVQKALGKVPIVPILVGSVDAEGARQLAEGLRQLVDSRTLLVVSSDFTHYGPRFHNTFLGPEVQGKELSARITQADEILLKPLLKGDLAGFDALARKTKTSTCGQDALRVMLALLPEGARGTVRKYDNSFAHDDTDPLNEVSYAAIAYPGSWPDVAPFSPADQQALLAFARAAMAADLEGKPPPPPGVVSPRIAERHGVFVTLIEKGQLRGSVGRAASDQGLGQTLSDVALAAAKHDPRYPPLTRAELDAVHIELSIIGPLRPLADASILRLGTDGLVLQRPEQTTLLLPQVASEQHLDLDGLLAALADKSGLARSKWPRDGLRSFTAQVMAEPGAKLDPPPPPPAPDAGP